MNIIIASMSLKVELELPRAYFIETKNCAKVDF